MRAGVHVCMCAHACFMYETMDACVYARTRAGVCRIIHPCNVVHVNMRDCYNFLEDNNNKNNNDNESPTNPTSFSVSVAGLCPP